MQIDGTIEGDITSKKLTISSSAVIRGSVEADAVIIAGQVTGQVKAHHVTLLKTARVIADVIHKQFTVEAGALKATVGTFQTKKLSRRKHYSAPEQSRNWRLDVIVIRKPCGILGSRRENK